MPLLWQDVGHVAVKNVEARGEDGALTATVLACPRCDFVLGASINPIEYVAALMRQLRPDPAASPA
jgi:uncharacterized C2H2 Zn-finger protein